MFHVRPLKEGGYEGATAMIYYGQPSPWSAQVEESIIEAVVRESTAVSPGHQLGSTVSPVSR
jgi:neutral ceramidase